MLAFVSCSRSNLRIGLSNARLMMAQKQKTPVVLFDLPGQLLRKEATQASNDVRLGYVSR